MVEISLAPMHLDSAISLNNCLAEGFLTAVGVLCKVVENFMREVMTPMQKF